MTTETILTSLIDWAGSRDIQIAAIERSQPPAFLDMRPLLNADEADSAGAGLLVSIDSGVHGGVSAQLGFWIPNSLKKGTWSSMGNEEDDEIASDWIPEFSNEKELVAFFERETSLFFLKHIQEAVLDEWLADKGFSYTVLREREFCGDAAARAEELSLADWLIVEFTNAKGYGVTLGISGWGEAATFYANEDGFLTFDQHAKGLRTSDALVEWLESNVTSRS